MKNFTFLTNLRNSNQVMTRLRLGNNQVKTTWRFIALLTLIFTLGVGNAWGAAGDEVTAVSNITSGKWYYIKGIRSDGKTIEYLTFTDATGNQSGTSSSTTGGALPLKFSYESSNWYITTPKGYYITTNTTNSSITVTGTKTSVTLANASSLISIRGASYYIQKNTSGTSFGSYNNTQNNVSLIEVAEHTVSWSVNDGAAGGSPSAIALDGYKVVTLPTEPTSSDCDNSKVFVGWSASAIDGTTDSRPSDLFKTADQAPPVTGNVTYYAVFATSEGSSTLLSENFSSASSGNNTTTDGQSADWSGNDNITSTSTVKQAGGAVRLATGSYVGYFITKSLTAAVGTVLTISFDVKGWTSIESSSDHPGIEVFGNSSEFTAPNAITYTSTMSGSFQTKSVDVQLTTANPRIKIYSYGRAFIDNLSITGATYSSYATSCCSNTITLSDPSITDTYTSGSTITFDKASPVVTCSGGATVKATFSPAAGYQATALSFTVNSGTVGISPSISTPVTSQTEYTLTFAENQKATLTTTATIGEKPVTGWTWKQELADASEITIPATVNLYVGQQAKFVLKEYIPSDVLSGKKGYSADYISADLAQDNKAGLYYITRAKQEKASTTLTLESSSNSSVQEIITIQIKALPSVTFTDLVHGETFGVVSATIDASDKRIVYTTKKTPIHVDMDDPGTGNSCERNHLHLIGWIDKDWADTHLDATQSEILAAGAGIFYAPNVDINLATEDGKTYYAVWSKME